MATHAPALFRGYTTEVYALLAVSSLRRLMGMRHDPVEGAAARYHARKWVAGLRALRAVDPDAYAACPYRR